MIVRLLALALALLPASAGAHGGHDGHGAAPAGGGATVTVGGYTIELLSHPAPLARGQAGHVVAKVLRSDGLDPATGGEVLIGLAAPGAEPEPAAAPEQTWAGHYAVAVTPERAGPHQVRVVLVALDGRPLEPPLVVDAPVTVERAPGMGGAAWAALALVGGLAALAVYAARLPAAPALDLLAIPWLRALLTSRAVQRGVQIALLGVTAVVVYAGLADVQDGGVNLATKLTWTIWWAGIIFTFVLAGRVWCVACPFGALNEWTARLSGAWRRLPRPFRNIWWATAAFVALTWADEQLGVVRSPRVTAWIVLFFVGLAVAIGLVYERRSFCRHLCPIGGLIGIYSMTAPIELRAKDAATCRTHAEKGCYQGTATAAGCPMFEFPQAMDRNNYCTLCAECVKGCARDNLVLRFRAFGKDLWASRRRVLDEAYLAAVLVGLTLLVTAQMLTAWPGWISALARWLPAGVRASLKPVTYLTLVESAVLLVGALVVGPALVLLGAAVADRLAGDRRLGLRRTFVVFAYMFVPVGLAVHLAHNLAHLLLEGGGIVPVVQRAAGLYTPLWLGVPDWSVEPLAPEPVVGLLQVAVLVGFFLLSLAAGRRLAAREYADPQAAGRAVLPFVVLSLAFTVAGIVLLQQPMGMRHGM
ncbi:MAG: 4Fe-4S binding protein [Candidatus Rokubacteria bacterium]|nr:4Fe-4S binding protein [Candidatus Rokubacteria bacterium]